MILSEIMNYNESPFFLLMHPSPDPEAKDLREILNVSDKPLNKMGQKELCPGSERLQDINSGLK